MSILGWAAGAYIVSRIIKKENKRRRMKEASNQSNYDDPVDNRQPYIPCRFEDGFSEADFEAIVKKEAKKIRRIHSIQEYGGTVNGIVQSQSGISDWEFTIDFNCAGHITGAYSISTENDDSGIPSRLAENISSAVRLLCEQRNSQHYSASNDGDYGLYCPYCGEFTPGFNVKFCFYCGKQLL